MSKKHKRKRKVNGLSWKQVKSSKIFKTIVGNTNNEISSINNIAFKQQTKLIQMSDSIAEYDYKMEKLNIWAVSFNPQFKMKHTMNYGKLYTSKINDLSILKMKWKNGDINFKKYKEQIYSKNLEIASYQKEISQLRGNDNFKGAFINNAINTLNENIWYKYFNAETGEPDPNGVMYKDLERGERMNVLNYIYDNADFYKQEFTKTDFINRAIQVSENFDKKETGD